MREMFSSRTDWDVHPSAHFSLLQEKRSNGEQVIDLTESNPTRCGITSPAPLFETESLQRSLVYEPDPKGLVAARQTIAAWYNKQHRPVEPEQIVLTASTSEAYSFLLRLLCNVDEAVATPRPSYPLFEYLCRLHDVACRHYGLAYDGEWYIDIGSLEETLTRGAKALILVHPNNPTGSYIKSDERKRILKLAASHGTVLIVDEVFHSFPFGNDTRRAGSFAGTPDILTFTVNGLSKLVALPQMKLAWTVVSGPREEVKAALGRLEIISDTYLSVGTPVQQALGSILEQQGVRSSRVLERVRGNYAELQRIVAGDSPITVFRCEGGWNAILRLPATRSDEAWALRLLQSENVLAHPGHLFDCEIGSCVVLSLLSEPQLFSEGVHRMCSATMV
jgi:aspartate/methionine/tyrosine aminotransferase